MMSRRQAFEHEFLIRLAPVWLACRYRIMRRPLSGKWPPSDVGNDLLGMVDYAAEMKLLCAEHLKPPR